VWTGAYELNGRLYCANCAKSAIEYAKSSGQAAPIAGYVDKSMCSRCNSYENSDNFTAQFFVSIGPLIVNTVLCMVFCTAAFLPVRKLKVVDPLAYLFYWLGTSIGMHAFPSTVDLSHLWKAAPTLAKKGNLLAILSLPLGAILVVLNYGRVLWADLGCGLLVGMLGPSAIFRALVRL
jgi:hypothetical protein